MKSIQTKFLILILGCVILCSAVIGSAGILCAKRVVDMDSAQIMNLMCEKRAGQLDALFYRIEQSVGTLSVYAQEQLESVEKLKSDPLYIDEYTEKLESVAVNAANNTEGALAVYIRFNPDFTPPTSGIFWSKTDSSGTFQKLTPTDFSSYSPTDLEHVGWYYVPVKNGKATWMSPYTNQNINEQMVSYVIPLYKDNVTVGVVGMDINFAVVENLVADIQIYRNGYGFLTDETGMVMYHRDLDLGTQMGRLDSSLVPAANELENETSGSNLFTYQWNGQEKKMAFRTLRNGMRLSITAPVKEIDQSKNDLIRLIIIAVAIISILSVVLTVIFTRRLIRPLKELNDAAKKIADGDLSISFTHKAKDEVGTLAESFQKTVSHLQQYIDYINGLAYRDSLTGAKNKTAYQEAEKQMDEKIRLGRPEFAVAVFDINNLKIVNDNYGHDFGDMLIIDASRLICRTFRHSPVYRIGGDEFVVILEDDDFEKYSVLLEEFQKNIEDHNKNARVDNSLSIARGIAVYSSDTDLVFANVFKRADSAMYQNKAAMKELERAARI
ncbi:MAG: diguanylate cyclase [Eubacteriales bacterium]|nr:diguanylate cyclase [Eubacteriales bacterium]